MGKEQEGKGEAPQLLSSKCPLCHVAHQQQTQAWAFVGKYLHSGLGCRSRGSMQDSEGVTGKLCSDIRKSSSRWKDQDGQRGAPVFRLSTSGCE